LTLPPMMLLLMLLLLALLLKLGGTAMAPSTAASLRMPGGRDGGEGREMTCPVLVWAKAGVGVGGRRARGRGVDGSGGDPGGDDGRGGKGCCWGGKTKKRP
jgi:hypothetical protein